MYGFNQKRKTKHTSQSMQCVSAEHLQCSRALIPLLELPLPLFSSLPPFFFFLRPPALALSLSRTASGAALWMSCGWKRSLRRCVGRSLSLHGEQLTLSSGKSVNEALSICWRLSASCGWISGDFRERSAEKQQKFGFQKTPSNSENARFLARVDICWIFCDFWLHGVTWSLLII